MVHGVLNSLQYSLCEAARLSHYDVTVLIVEEPKLNRAGDAGWQKKLRKIASLSLKHIQAGLRISAEKSRDAIILPDFSTEFLFLTYLFSGCRTQNVYTLVHHNAQQALHNPLMSWLLKFYNLLGYKFLLNETLSALSDLGYRRPEEHGNAILLHPVKPENPDPIGLDSQTSVGPYVGIVGSVRKGKRFEETLQLLQQLQTRLNFTLVVGVDQPELLAYLQDDDRIILLDTATHAQYLSVIGLCDVIVLNYEESQYRYRCSGVAADAIGTKTYVVAPDYPMIRHQLLYPTPIGVTYRQESELEAALQTALELPPAESNSGFEQHYTTRSEQGLAIALDHILDTRMAQRRPSVGYPKTLL